MKKAAIKKQLLTPWGRRSYAYAFAFSLLVILGSFFLLTASYKYAYVTATPEPLALETRGELPFPIGVDPIEETITEDPTVDAYFYDHLSNKKPSEQNVLSTLMTPLLGKLALFSWYQNVASPSTRILIIEPGERREQIAFHFGKILGWDEGERREFIASVISLDPIFFEGKFTPGSYVVARDAKPLDVALLVSERFRENVLSRYPRDIAEIVSIDDALTIASLLEREAYDFDDMRYIAGIIWNRLFTDMKLQIDATLQYAKADTNSKVWWPKVIPQDKYIASDFNTYKNLGLPPHPIANPGANAILAALNPRQTECMYYFHDKEGGFHCAKTYEEHVALLREYYGQGK
jgi:cell division protein YceG involved in septum cleavage